MLVPLLKLIGRDDATGASTDFAGKFSPHDQLTLYQDALAAKLPQRRIYSGKRGSIDR